MTNLGRWVCITVLIVVVKYRRRLSCAQDAVVSECVGLQSLNRRHHELIKSFSPRLINLKNEQGTRLAISASVCLVTSKFIDSEFVKKSLENVKSSSGLPSSPNNSIVQPTLAM